MRSQCSFSGGFIRQRVPPKGQDRFHTAGFHCEQLIIRHFVEPRSGIAQDRALRQKGGSADEGYGNEPLGP